MLPSVPSSAAVAVGANRASLPMAARAARFRYASTTPSDSNSLVQPAAKEPWSANVPSPTTHLAPGPIATPVMPPTAPT